MKWTALAGAAMVIGLGAPLFAQASPMPDYRISSPESFRDEEESVTHAAIAPGFSIGLRGAYMNDPDVDFDSGEVFGGAVVRVHIFDMLSVEGYGAWHREDENDVETDIYPVQLSALIYFFPHSPISPYLIGGVGWYFFDVEFDHPFEEFDFDDESFGYHAGLGIDFQLGPHVSITVDGRYIWLENESDFIPEVSDDEAYQLMGGINFDF
jgi:opacity protein-like surface antigen